jgi:glycyl-tRNA synthetase
LGLAVIGKVFRNEISPRQFFFRLREFTQAELQVFFDPDTIDDCQDFTEWNSIKANSIKVLLADSKKEQILTLEQLNKKGFPRLYLFFMLKMQEFYLNTIKLPQQKIRFRQLSEDEKAFYNKIHFDVEVLTESLNGFKEIAGLHYRTNYDLNNHEQASKQNLKIFFNNKTFLPHVIELSFGIDRNIYAIIDLFIKQEKERNVLSLPVSLSPYDVAVFPLVNKQGMPEIAFNVFKELNKHFKCFYDESGSIGRRYRRQDEIGTPFCITIDGQTLKDKTVTVRERDSMKQERISIAKLVDYLKSKSTI